MADAQKVVATAGLVSVGVGSANSILKYKQPPSMRFLIGSGMAFLVFSAMAGASEDLGELAKGLALGVMTTILLGEGGGVMTYFVGEKEVNTTAPKPAAASTAEKSKQQQAAAHLVAHQSHPNGSFRSDRIAPQPFLPVH